MGKVISLTSVLFLFLFIGCERQEVAPPSERTKIDLNIVLFDTEVELNKHIQERFVLSPHTRKGLAMWYKDDISGQCTLYLVRGLTDTVTYGHELMHCIYGAYHDEPD